MLLTELLTPSISSQLKAHDIEQFEIRFLLRSGKQSFTFILRVPFRARKLSLLGAAGVFD